MESDWTERLQELQALQSIYGDDFQFLGLEGDDSEECTVDDVDVLTSLEKPSGPVSLHCQVLVRLELDEPLTIIVGDSDDAAVSVKHLPPLCLHLLLPHGYPSSCLPDVQLTTPWLRVHEQNAVVEQLLELGSGMLGYPVVFEWTQWVKENTLIFLGATNAGLRLQCAQGNEAGGSSPASPGDDGRSTGVLLRHLHGFSTMQEIIKFRDGMWQCGICFEELPGTRCVRLPGCTHFFCLDCMQQHARVHVADGQLASLVCPSPDCRKPLALEVLKVLLSEEDFRRWEDLTLSRSLDCMTDLVYCPRCQAASLEDERDHCAQCPNCMYVFCGLCLDGWHPGSDCVETSAKLEVLRKRNQHGGGSEKNAAATLNAINELKSLKMMKDTTKRCPTCRMAIHKTGGCNKMICSNCETKFCYKCGKKIDGYEHFSAMTCLLFDQAEVDEWNARMNRNQAVGQWQAEFFGLGMAADLQAWADGPNIKASRCPQCGQPNAKVNNNNHISCWSCGSHHCYLCRKVIGGGGRNRSGGRHFSTKGCRQHSPD